MKFKELGLQDIERLRPYFTANDERICDATVGYTFMWRDMCRTEYAIERGVLFLKANYRPGATGFAPPRCQDGPLCREHFAKIEDYCREHGLPPRLCSVPSGLLETVRQLCPGARETTDPAWSDYIYNAEDIVTLAGRRYSGQRNHINKFRKTYEDWRFETVSDGNIAQVREFFASYAREHTRDDDAYEEGNLKALEVIDNMEAYGQLGGALFVGDSIAGAAFGETVGDTLFVHTEKALTEFNGAYPMLVNQFAQKYAGDGKIKYINREEDDGVEGLRISKQSYHPCALLEKYVVEWDAAGSARG
ncbi:MAG: phosphatidylglycerol lysyltransferase domain-containing protein [Oscillospiraceae bacterium]|nr:phosphatidylglycerol lysyltransferase domain-containing protein [Oscillospiraceae bacterium]